MLVRNRQRQFAASLVQVPLAGRGEIIDRVQIDPCLPANGRIDIAGYRQIQNEAGLLLPSGSNVMDWTSAETELIQDGRISEPPNVRMPVLRSDRYSRHSSE